MASKGQAAGGEDQDDCGVRAVHDRAAQADGHHAHQNITVSAASAGETLKVADRIITLLRTRHTIEQGEPDDFMVRTLEEMANVRTQATRTMTALLASIAGVSLLVGGIGIMNIMLVSVTERTREIGLRMSVGARGRDVLLQFLVEAIVLSLVGGLIGIGLGVGFSRGVTQFLQWPAEVSMQAVARGVRVRGGDRRVLRVLPGPQGGTPRPDRRAALRVTQCPGRNLIVANSSGTPAWSASVSPCPRARPGRWRSRRTRGRRSRRRRARPGRSPTRSPRASSRRRFPIATST